MSAVVKLSSKMPGDPETNGVDSLSRDLCLEPDTLRVAVVWFDTQKVTHDTDTGTDVPTIRVRRIEPVGYADDAPTQLVELVAAAVEERTGRKGVPFELVVVDQAQTTIDDA